MNVLMRPDFLLILALLISACGRSRETANGRETPAAPSHSQVINMTDAMAFEPTALTVAVGDTVVWVGTGATPHTVTDKPGAAGLAEHTVLPAGARPWDSGLVDQGKRFQWVFTTPGEYTYVCLLHEANGMVGHITVR